MEVVEVEKVEAEGMVKAEGVVGVGVHIPPEGMGMVGVGSEEVGVGVDLEVVGVGVEEVEEEEAEGVVEEVVVVEVGNEVISMSVYEYVVVDLDLTPRWVDNQITRYIPLLVVTEKKQHATFHEILR